MTETFKKGQMVPKRLKMALTHRKAQHLITFGCDVVVNERVISPVRPDDGPIFFMQHSAARRCAGIIEPGRSSPLPLMGSLLLMRSMCGYLT